MDLGGERLYYYAAGTRGVGAPVLLLHGLLGSGHVWRELARRAPPGHRLVVCDLLGHGRSDLPAAADYSIAGHARRMLALMDALGITRAFVGGHHLGAAVAMELALAAPDRVLGLLLCDALSGAHQHLGMRVARRLVPLARRLPAPLVTSLWHGTMLRGFTDRLRLGRRAVDVFLRPYLQTEGRDAMLASLAALDPAESAALTARAGRIVCPTVIVWGEEDPFIPPAEGDRLRTLIPGARIEVLPAMRHFTPEEAPERVAAVLRHLLSAP